MKRGGELFIEQRGMTNKATLVIGNEANQLTWHLMTHSLIKHLINGHKYSNTLWLVSQS